MLLDIIIKSLLIGLLSSAPMGPVGMLCVQRTLNEGRKSGLMTGLGAIVGDILIAIVTVVATLGLGFNTEFFQKHQWVLQIVGSIVLIIFGMVVFQKNPSRNLRASKQSVGTSNWALFGSSLGLTVSNIATLFLYIALFARFNIINSDMHIGYTFLALLSIGMGAFSWWLFITYLVNKLRKVFNPRGLQIFNKIIGVILISIGIVGIFSSIYTFLLP